MQAIVQGIGLFGPGLDGWAAGSAVLRGEREYMPARTQAPAPQLLPAAERRRTNLTVKLALAAGFEAVQAAGRDPRMLASVFSSSGADGHNCHEICEALASPAREISPTRFHNSVHNAAAGYWSIATGSMSPCNVLSAFDASFAAGLLETLVQVQTSAAPVLLIGYDTQYPEPLHARRPLPDAFGVSLLLAPAGSSAGLAQVQARLGEGGETRLPLAALESLRASIPAARSLPLLQSLAAGIRGDIVLPYLPPLQLVVSVRPCG